MDTQGAYNSGKLGDFLILDNLGKTQGNLKYTLEIFENQMVCFADAI